jgi:hypothetical protein
MIMRNTRESALRRDTFHQVLQRWLDESFDEHIGETYNHAGPAWLWVRHGGEHYYLDALSTRAGIREYLHVTATQEGEVEWHVHGAAPNPVRERVSVGAKHLNIDGFDFYRHVPRR